MNNKELVEMLVRRKVLKTPSIISAFSAVDRANFCLEKYKKYAYVDQPLPILAEQTISQPTTVAIMTEAIAPRKKDKVLEIGSGSGYQAAILAESVKPGKVYTIERINELCEFARKNLKKYKNVEILCEDGSAGLQKRAPFDCIIVTACAPEVPEVLKKQLRLGGRMVIPVGKNKFVQDLLLIKKTEKGFETTNLGPFAFVPLIGKLGFD